MATEAQEEKNAFNAAFNGDEVIPAEQPSGDQDEGLEQAADIEQEASNADETESPEAVAESTSVESEINGLSDEAMKAIEDKLAESIEGKMSQRFRNYEGMIGALKQKLEQLTTAKPAVDKPASSAEEIKDTLDDSEKMKTIRNDLADLPEIQQLVDVMIEERQQGRRTNADLLKRLEAAENSINSTADKVNQSEERQAQELGIKTIEARHPDYKDFLMTGSRENPVYGKMFQSFNDWLEKQPPGIKSMARESSNPNDAISVLDMFKRTLPPVETAEQEQKSDTTSAKANQRLANAITPTTGGQATTPAKKTQHDAFIAAFNSS